MRVNIYSQELPLGVTGFSQIESGVKDRFSFVRLFLHSSDRLHHPPQDDDRSALTFWLPRSPEKRAILAGIFDHMAASVREAPPEIGSDQ